MAHLLGGESDKLCLKVEEMLRVLEEKEIPRIKKCIQSFCDNHPDIHPTALRDELQKTIKEEITKGFDTFRKDTEGEISNKIQETLNRFTNRSNNIVNEFKTASEILFEVPIEHLEFSVELMKDNSFYYMIQEYTATTDEEVKSILRAILPRYISRKMVIHEMLERVVSDINRNCGRVRYSITSRLRKTIDHYSKQLKNLGHDLTHQIEQAIQKGQLRRQAGSESVRAELVLLANKVSALEGQREMLDQVWGTINLRDKNLPASKKMTKIKGTFN